ncbi:hypothetical protein D9M72_556140 [compost metagenome]
MVQSLGMALFTSRQPSVVEARFRSPAGYGFSVLGSTQGARDIDSAPPISISSASPAFTWREAIIAASSEDPQSRFTVVPGIETGSPASRVPIRATFRFSSPAPLALPNTTSSIRSTSSFGARFTISPITCAARSSGRTPAKPEPNFPKGVRTASYTKASFITIPLDSGGPQLGSN